MPSYPAGPSSPRVEQLLAIDRVSKFAYVELHATAEMATGAAFMRGVVAAFPYRIHTVLTDNGVAFTRCAAGQTHEISPISGRGVVSEEAMRGQPEPAHPRLSIQRLPRLSR
jgi:hypothetical protein